MTNPIIYDDPSEERPDPDNPPTRDEVLTKISFLVGREARPQLEAYFQAYANAVEKRKAIRYVVDDYGMDCKRSPSQWEGWTTCGRAFYIRFRWGCLTVSITANPVDRKKEEKDASTKVDYICAGCRIGEEILEIRIGKDYDGLLSHVAMQKWTVTLFDWLPALDKSPEGFRSQDCERDEEYLLPPTPSKEN